jgi:hypothetical protein
MYVQVRFLQRIPCSGCQRALIRDGPVVEPIANRDGSAFEYDEGNPPRSIVLGLHCTHCGAETTFIRNGANTETYPQPNPPTTITKWSPYVVEVGYS